jgi:hypothetical protein
MRAGQWVNLRIPRSVVVRGARGRRLVPVVPACSHTDMASRPWPLQIRRGVLTGQKWWSGRGRTADLPLFRRGVRQVDAPLCERRGLSPVVAISRWLLLLLSSLLSAISRVTARLEFRSHESDCHRWVMSTPSAVATRPGPSLTPMLASADDTKQSRPVSPRSAPSEVSWSQSRSQWSRPTDAVAGFCVPLPAAVRAS